ncbi:hypothetical protein [Acidisphaera rubrifaciens]|uniref:Transposase n=1 Tax=Acidisphaera rubrifaciens HS-AP3 TaxID=1231350 RepID=A0A0D6P7W9_9PROT|nr:hypothetical protein [Acidisphaera rubrifaciens]GAN77752.1 hypothetical protein Asru_0442_02 [Acidisphaera rubrifaciens HS-AP3]
MSDDVPGKGEAPTAAGILECLRMLVAEAASLRMTQTVTALSDAIAACAAERRGTGPQDRVRLH